MVKCADCDYADEEHTKEGKVYCKYYGIIVASIGSCHYGIPKGSISPYQQKDKRTWLGRGWLNWNRIERIGDRYGSVGLMDKEGSKTLPSVAGIEKLEGHKGRLIAVVRKTRTSGHIGDLFRGFQPTTPEVGEEIVLGSGVLFFWEDVEKPKLPEILTGFPPKTWEYVGLKPLDARTTDWLDPQKLYRAHDQYVDLYFDEGETERRVARKIVRS